MRFEDPIYLYLLIIIPVMIILHVVTDMLRRRRMKRLGDQEMVSQLINTSSKRLRLRRELKFSLLMLALASMILMLARPQILGAIQQRTENRQGIEMMVCLDVSNSMLAEDVMPSRMDKCKMLLENLIDRFSKDKIGLIVFAGDAFIQLPLTADYVSAKMFLQNITPGMIQTQGTDIARAIDIASHSFSNIDDIGRAIVVITDGEDHEGGAEDAAKAAKKKGMKTYILGVGSTKGAPIKIDGSYLTDENGQTVMTRLNEDMCRKIASAGGGKYIHVDNTTIAQERLAQVMSNLARQDIETSVYTERSEQFQAFALLALIFLIIEIIIQEKKMLFKRLSKKIPLILLLGAFSLASSAQNDRAYIRKGNRAYRSKDYVNAEVAYRKALEQNPNNPQANYNLGNALLYQGKDSLAVVQYEKALQSETDPMRQAKVYHNIGVVCQANKNFSAAIDAYKQSLRRNPDDDETRYNLVLCQKQQKDDKNNNDKNNNQNKDNKNNKDNKDNKDKNQDKKDDKNNDNKDQNKDKNQNKDNPEQPQNQQPQKGEMSRENAEQLLNAAAQQERETQQKLKAIRGTGRKLKKNW